jgi:chemotaxis regulatin CheY-phosphate phosphatase CheZ
VASAAQPERRLPLPKKPSSELGTTGGRILGIACAETLPALASTLSAMIQASEVAAQRVLDQTDRLGAGRQALCAALERLEPFIDQATPEAREACALVIDGVRAVSECIEPLVSSMEFQDLTAQHLRASIEAVEALRGQLSEVLALCDSRPIEAAEAPTRIDARLGSPAASAHWRQALADELINNRPGRR